MYVRVCSAKRECKVESEKRKVTATASLDNFLLLT
jgi:hypothetical protein